MNYDYECPVHGRFEVTMTLADYEAAGDVIECPCSKEGNCEGSMEQILLPRRNSTGRARLTPICYLKGPDGKLQISASSNSRVQPHGMEKLETHSLMSARKLQKEMNEQDRREFSISYAAEQRYLSDQISEAHSEMHQLMQSYDPIFKDMARIAMENNNHGKPGPWERSGEKIDFGYIEVLEMDERRRR